MFLVIIGIIVAAAWAYAHFLRPRLAEQYPAIFSAIDGFWLKSRTILAARLYWVGGFVVGIHDALAAAGLDWTPVTTQVTSALTFIPEEYRPMALSLFLIVTGSVFERLRKLTTDAVGETPPPQTGG